MIKSSDLGKQISIRIGMLFSRIPITPNAWTAFSLVPAVAGLFFLLQKDLLMGAALFAISAFMDAIDGAVARVSGRVTQFGAYIDGIVDRFVEMMMLVGLLFAGLPDFILPSSVLIAILVFFSVFVSYTRAYADHKGVVDEGSLSRMGGLFERPERMTLLLVAMATADGLLLVQAIALADVLSFVTSLQRIRFAALKRI